MRRLVGTTMVAGVLVACSVGDPAANQSSQQRPANDAAPAIPAPPPAAPGQRRPGDAGGLPDDRAPLNEGSMDLKGAEGAGQAAQMFGALLEQRRFAEARALWGDQGKASGLTEAEFAAAYDRYATIHSEVGRPGDLEGAAGSLYATVPFRLYGTLKSGAPFNLIGSLTFRRVNDVDGSTAEQRRWHIAQIDLKPSA